jgi:hypothetical protein
MAYLWQIRCPTCNRALGVGKADMENMKNIPFVVEARLMRGRKGLPRIYEGKRIPAVLKEKAIKMFKQG